MLDERYDRLYRTRRIGENEADYCRMNGLLPGTKLIGDEGYGNTVFLITALGEEKILGRSAKEGHEFGHEHTLTLSCRDWQILEVST